MTGALAGVRVIDATGLGPGPYCAMLLGDMGADVIRVERSASHGRGRWDPTKMVMHRNRRSVVIDLKQSAGVEVFMRLVEQSDVLLEGNRPGVMERLGAGPDICLERNPRIVYGRMTGWGQDGPLARTAGHDITYLAAVGALGLFARRGERPVVPLNVVADYGGGGMFLAFGVMCALFEAQRSGRGQVIDAAMIDGVAGMLGLVMANRAMGVWNDEPGTNVNDTGAPFYDVYATADGRYLAVGALEPAFYDALLDGLGLDPSTLPAQFDRAEWPRLKDVFAERIATKSRDEWVAIFAGVDACVEPVFTLDEAAQHPHHLARGTWIDDDGLVQPAPGPRLGRTPGSLRRPPPQHGVHTAEVMAELGYNDGEIAELFTSGAVA